MTDMTGQTAAQEYLPEAADPGTDASGQAPALTRLEGTVVDGVRIEAPFQPADTPDPFGRLWTPHRMVYIGGQDKPSDDSADQCPFCAAPGRSDTDALIVHRGETAYVLMNLYPYNTGHLLICPYRHISDWTEATAAERTEIGVLTARAMEVVRAVSHPHGFNLGMNQGQVAGAGIAAHLHQHVVPRWTGDANFMPIIGKTKPVPQLLGDQRDQLAAAWDSAPTALDTGRPDPER
ncbi:MULTISPECIES: HIT domain-containing protein [unclassified Actinomyces]|uniref:Histidine triad (Hit) protein n=1 Tax=Actinomyces glycerinitolerans TaxID=1892869 RepID=A0A1M4S1K5_9ACTO|nr:histidine triad (hit) protein [Actinomyces glycerinitolerans]